MADSKKLNPDDHILRLLRDHPSVFVSGEKISRELKLTRTAVWKRMKNLRSLGYVIEASRRSGYRLVYSPDLLFPSEILSVSQTKWMGKKIHYFDALDSTNWTAYELALRGGEEGEVVIAESQKKGRGRLGRHWISPPHTNLYLSVILRPKIPPHHASLVTFMAAVATADAIEKYSNLKPSIKWPNDLLLKERKVAGLLNEIHSEADHIHFIILGIGINLNMGIKRFPEEIRNKATSLSEEMGRTVSRREFAALLLEELERWYEILSNSDGTPVLRAWRERAQIAGKKVKVSFFGQVQSGNAVDVDSDGALILRLANGEQKRIVAGDVEYS